MKACHRSCCVAARTGLPMRVSSKAISIRQRLSRARPPLTPATEVSVRLRVMALGLLSRIEPRESRAHARALEMSRRLVDEPFCHVSSARFLERSIERDRETQVLLHVQERLRVAACVVHGMVRVTGLAQVLEVGEGVLDQALVQGA